MKKTNKSIENTQIKKKGPGRPKKIKPDEDIIPKEVLPEGAIVETFPNGDVGVDYTKTPQKVTNKEAEKVMKHLEKTIDKPKENTEEPKKKTNPWLQHVKQFKESHPDISNYRDILKAAKTTYKKQ